jgi:hypothetical protein
MGLYPKQYLYNDEANPCYSQDTFIPHLKKTYFYEAKVSQSTIKRL